MALGCIELALCIDIDTVYDILGASPDDTPVNALHIELLLVSERKGNFQLTMYKTGK